MQTVEIFDTYAPIYNQKFNMNPLVKYQRAQVHELIRPYLISGTRILDVGCGPGSDFQFYQTHDLKIHVIDISGQMVELAKTRAEELGYTIQITQSSLEKYKPDCLYDLIVLNFGVINVFGNLAEILNKLSSLLLPTGTLIVGSMPRFHLFFLLEQLIKLNFAAIAARLFRKEAILKNGYKIYYYGKTDFTPLYDLVKRRNLGSFLPTPDQYTRWNWAKIIGNMLMKFDSLIASALPDWFGGDHVCYILRPGNNQTHHV